MEKEKLVQTVKLAQKGDSDALNELFNAFYNDVYYFALKNVKDEDLACDITQEAFVEIINTLGNLKEPAAFVTWMKQITYHQCTRYFKKKKDVLVDENEDGDTIFDTMAEERTEFIPDEAVDQADFRATIMAMIDQLPDEQRAATMMYYFDEMSVKEIAQAQGVGENTVKGRLSYSRKAIKKSVEDYEKKNNVKLHCVGLLPLLLWLFRSYGSTMPPAFAPTVAEGITIATGTTVTISADASTGAAVAPATITATGIGAKIGAMPAIAKAISCVVVAAMVVGGAAAVIVSRNHDNADIMDTTATILSGSTEDTTLPATEENPSVDIPSEPIITEYVVPEGCIYTAVTGEVFQGGDIVTVPCSTDDEFTDGEYVYKYGTFRTADGTVSAEGWSVAVLDKSKSEYIPLQTEINKALLRILDGTFSECVNLTTAPDIPEGIIDMADAFKGCTALAKAPIIPKSVRYLASTFEGCTSLKKAPDIPSGVICICRTFYNCPKLQGLVVIDGELHSRSDGGSYCSEIFSDNMTRPIFLAGDNSQLFEISRNYQNYNIFTTHISYHGQPNNVEYYVPAGCVYTAVTGEVFHEGERVTVRCSMGDEFTDGEYVYWYALGTSNKGAEGNLGWWSAENGWYPDVIDRTKKEYLPVLTSINGDQISGLLYTYKNCSNLVAAPEIPEGIERIDEAFRGCTSLVAAPILPSTIKYMNRAFYGCSSLEQAPVIPASVIEAYGAFGFCEKLHGEIIIHAELQQKSSDDDGYLCLFDGCQLPIALSGTSSQLEKIAELYENVYVK